MLNTEFELSDSQISQIAASFEQAVFKGLLQPHSQLKSLPTFVPVTANTVSGKVAVLDLGGSNLRAAIVEIAQNKLVKLNASNTIKMPWLRGEIFAKNALFELQAEALNHAGDINQLPVGYCFSFPTTNLINGDARLLHWTKGLNIPQMEGELIGQNLQDYLTTQLAVKIPDITVINDTVACLLAGLSQCKADAYFGLIAGTGFNMAALIPANKIKNSEAQTAQYPNDILLPVNLESGNFMPEFLTEYDQIIDASSENQGDQLFEKAVSGMYLSRVFKAACPDVLMDVNEGAEAVVKFIDNDTQNPAASVIAQAIYQRAACMIAAQIWGLVLHHVKYIDSQSQDFCVTCEGGLFWSYSTKLGHFSELVQQALTSQLAQSNYTDLNIQLIKVEQANLVGSAIAAIAKQTYFSF
ncbi:hypothetical protein N7931_09940 [Catenovulum sp. 2E275]|uniref:hexokinase family protein n=1 Tax=Catenovulum sp. 2E275 TaxID=2980497 RepID=UPI0021CF2B3F|nr:hypothetical protein [Catenovulum sp. 2E275]MCU4675955.1 hypothetical protein [Catenovulum sp. 2E275]